MKTLAITAAVWVAIIPWFSGGRDAVALLVTVLALTGAWFLLLRWPRSTVASKLLWVATILLFAWSAASLFWTVNKFQTQIWLLYAAIFVMAFTVAAQLPIDAKRRMLKGYVWIAVAAALFGIYQYLTAEYGRLTSSFYWANPAAAYLLPAAFISTWEWVKAKPGRPKWAWFGAAAALSTAVWLTDSRGIFLVTALMLAGIMIFIKNIRPRWSQIALIMLLGFGLSLAFGSVRQYAFNQDAVTPGSRFSEAVQGESVSGKDRLNYLGSAYLIWKDFPATGTGAGTFQSVHPRYQQRVLSASTDAHNIYLQTLAELGVAGFMLMLAVALLLVIGIIRGIKKHPAMAAAGIGALALLVHFGLDIDGRYPALVALLAILAGASYSAGKTRPVSWKRSWTAPALIALALAIALGNYQSSLYAKQAKVDDENHDFVEAAKSYSKAHSTLVYDPDHLTAEGIDYYTMANLTGGSKSYLTRAKDRAERAIKSDPRDSQHWFLLGRVGRLEGNNPAAEAAYKQALARDRWNHPVYYQDLAGLYVRQGKQREARVLVDDALELYPDLVVESRGADPTIKPAVSALLTIRAIDELNNGRIKKARSDLTRAVKLNKNNEEAQKLLKALP